MTRQETLALQELFFSPAGRVLERELRRVGHLDTEIEDDQQRIEHNTVKEILTLCGCQLVLESRKLPEPAPVPEENLIDRSLQL